MTSFWGRHQITSPKIRHQNGVTKFFHFQAPFWLNSGCAPGWSQARRLMPRLHIQRCKFGTRYRKESLYKVFSCCQDRARYSFRER